MARSRRLPAPEGEQARHEAEKPSSHHEACAHDRVADDDGSPRGGGAHLEHDVAHPASTFFHHGECLETVRPVRQGVGPVTFAWPERDHAAACPVDPTGSLASATSCWIGSVCGAPTRMRPRGRRAEVRGRPRGGTPSRAQRTRRPETAGLPQTRNRHGRAASAPA